MLQKCAATIGVFDGVHAGHQQVIKRLVSDAHFHHLASMVITFDRQPRQLFDPQFRPQLLTTMDEKESRMKELGVDYLVVLPFTQELASLSARDFMEQILKERLNVTLLQIGYDNRFGHDRTKGFDDYVRYGEELGIRVFRGIKLSLQQFDVPVCSSSIRKLLAEDGDVLTAAALLERPYQLSGKVVPGEHIGHQLGFPTANLEPSSTEKLIPAPGVYAVGASLEGGEPKAAMMNIGTRPTFDGKQQTLEVNILDFDGDLYGKTVIIYFIDRLREERCFETKEALAEQLKKDKQKVIELFK